MEEPRLIGWDEAATMLRSRDVPCGCGEGHKMLPYCDRIAMFRGKAWVYECLLARLVRENEVLRHVLSGICPGLG